MSAGRRPGAVRGLAIAAFALLACTAGRAADLGARLRLLAAEDLRVATLFDRLARAAAPDCASQAPQPGLRLHDLAQYAPAARAEVDRHFGLGDHVVVLAVVPGGAAAEAGLIAGDILLAIDGVALPPVALDRQTGRAARAALAAIERAGRAGPVRLRISRGGSERLLSLAPPLACAGQISLDPASDLAARSGNGRLMLTTALVEFTPSDDELAFLIAHELAHLALAHDAAGPAAARREQEMAADRLGLRIMARAGFDPAAAPIILERLSRARGQQWRLDPSHPALQRRLDQLRGVAR